MKKILVATGSRAEYGLLRPLVARLQQSPKVELQILASAMHLSPAFGETYREIIQDGYQIDGKVDMLLSNDDPVATTTSIGLGVIGFGSELNRLRPDLLVLLGDRFEALAAAVAAIHLRIPIAHIHGGETTIGATDEAIRHAITKMSYLHFTSTEEYRRRVVQLGEAPDRVFNVGALGVENVLKNDPMPLQALEASLGFELGEHFFLATYHSETLGRLAPVACAEELLAAFDRFPQHKVLMTYPNADTDGRKLIELYESYAARNQDRFHLVRSLGQDRYLSAMRHCELIVGNSSSGIIEAPSVGVPTINIGDRQTGRVHARSVLTCLVDRAVIAETIEKGLSSDFRAGAFSTASPYGDGNTSRLIVEYLERASAHIDLAKSFHDLEFEI